MSKGNVLMGVLTGLAAGAILGVLFAPGKGSETRKKISKKGSDASDELKEKFNGLLEDINDQFDKIKKETKYMVESGRSKAEDLRKL